MTGTAARIDMDRVAALIREVAAREILPRWRNLATGDIVEKSGPDDLVTVADKAAEAALTPRLTDIVPGSTVVGEEAVAADPRVMERFRGSGPVWVVDPIDGTQAFATGAPEFTVMVGLVVGGRPVAGWIYAPADGIMHVAERGSGAWRVAGEARQRLTRPPCPATLAEMRGIIGRRMLTAARQARIEKGRRCFANLEPATYAGHQYPWLYDGRVHFCLYSKCEPWDHLPGVCIASEMGFVYGKHDGSPYLPGDNRGGLIVGHDQAQLTAIRAALLDGDGPA